MFKFIKKIQFLFHSNIRYEYYIEIQIGFNQLNHLAKTSYIFYQLILLFVDVCHIVFSIFCIYLG